MIKILFFTQALNCYSDHLIAMNQDVNKVENSFLALVYEIEKNEPKKHIWNNIQSIEDLNKDAIDGIVQFFSFSNNRTKNLMLEYSEHDFIALCNTIDFFRNS
jgi:hypothetical protein